jgi:hypothetical protein
MSQRLVRSMARFAIRKVPGLILEAACSGRILWRRTKKAVTALNSLSATYESTAFEERVVAKRGAKDSVIILQAEIYSELVSPFKAFYSLIWPPLWSSGQSSWLQIRRPGFDSQHYQKKSSGSGTGSTQPREYN